MVKLKNLLALAGMVFTFFGGSNLAIAATNGNLILNPTLSLDTITPGTPDDWNQGGWGTNTVAFNYPVTGMNGGIGANVTMSSYSSGDAKWYFNNVPVTPGANYLFADTYNATANSTTVAQITATNGTLSYITLANMLPTNGAWATTSTTITAPSNAAFVTVFHLINSVGSLTITNASLTLETPASIDFPMGLLSFRFDDGWDSHIPAMQTLNAAGLPGTFYIISNEMQNGFQTIFPSTSNPMNSSDTASSVTWSQIYPDPTQSSFNFTDTYTATTPSTITVKYQLGGKKTGSIVLGPFPAGTNLPATGSFMLPTIQASTPLTIVHSATGVGTLTASNPILNETLGYLNTAQVKQIQAAGNEIGNHTYPHCYLAMLLADPNSATIDPSLPSSACPDTGPFPLPITADQAITTGQTALVTAGFSPTTFAYPYGSGTGTTVEGMVQAVGLIAGLGTDNGYNTKATDQFALLNQPVEEGVTFATVKGWINTAIANKTWLILTFHQVEASAAILKANGEIYGTTTAILQDIVNYVAQEKAAGKLHVDTVNNIMVQYMNQ